MITILSERMRQLMAERKWTIQHLAKISELPEETVKNIYYAKTPDPKVSTIMKLAEAFNLSVNCLMGKCSHTPQERAILRNYRTCGKHGKAIIELIAKYEASSAIKERREDEEKHTIPCVIPQGEIRQGIIYDLCETVEIETTVEEAFIAIQITNNDLAPMFCKNDILLFENRFPRHGEKAAFYYDKKIYIRKFVEEDGQYKLQCLHKYDKDIILKRMDEVDYIGTCVDVLR